MTPGFHEHSSPSALAVDLAAEVAARLRAGLAARGAASLVVSGGRTPAAFLEALSAQELDWSRVQVTLADERRVPPDHADSNARLVREHLLRGAATAAHFLPLHVPGEDGDAVADGARLVARTRALAALPRPFDVLVLGMGDDGHTASLFPAAGGLEAALDPAAAPAVVAIVPPAAPHPRASMNLAMLLDARWIVLHIQGDSKRALLARILEGTPASLHPVGAVLRQERVPVDVHWAR